MYNYFSEFAGTALIIYILLVTGNPLAFGAAIALVMLITVNTSGGHLNPVVSVVMASNGKLPTSELIPYVICQFFGGLVALEIFKRYKL